MVEFLPKWSLGTVENLKVFAKIKLIFADLDGTLIYTNHAEIYDNINILLRALKHTNYKVSFIIATGRTLHGIVSILKKLDHKKNTPVILYNGGLIVQIPSYEILYKRIIHNDRLVQIIRLINYYKIIVFAYSFGETVLKDNIDDIEKVYGWTKATKPETEFNNMPIHWMNGEEITGEINAISVLLEVSQVPAEKMKCLIDDLSQIQGISYTSSGFSYVEIRPLNSDKAKAIELLSRKFGYLNEEILAIGDNDNDSEMLSWAGIGVSVANASENAKKNSDYLCSHNVSEGVVEVLRLVKNAKRYFK
ncbi:MAG: HAD family hydrolase [Prolixibacteraceae bacterium]|nr:HAD family hydrolase [Prolixibacteraceae bacterium]